MAEEKNCINADEYLANNPFMRHNHMKIERISTECSEISMEVHPDGLNIMGMIHGGAALLPGGCGNRADCPGGQGENM